MRLPYYATETGDTPTIKAEPVRPRSKSLPAQNKFYDETVADGLALGRWVRETCPGGFFDGLIKGTGR